MAFDDLTHDRDSYYPTPSSHPSGSSDGQGIVLLLAVAIGVALIMMYYPDGDGRVGVINTASPTFKTPPPPSKSTLPAEPTPKPTTEPTPDPTTEPNPNPTHESRPTQAPIQ
jgi:outer membrane biosynthesis protein TonB